MSNDEIVLRSPTIGGRCLELVFSKIDDRWRHDLRLVNGSTHTLLLRSSEGDGQQEWPPSPPLQDLDILGSKNGHDIVLAVGMSGKSHWSASIEPKQDALVFDLACLARQQPVKIGSVYEVFPDESHQANWAVDDGMARLVLDELTVECYSATAHRACRISVDSRNLSIQPAVQSENPKISTQWSYRFRLGLFD